MFAVDVAPDCRITNSEFGRQYLQDALDTRLTKSGQAPDVGPADTDGSRSERQRFEDIRAPPEATVDQHGNPTIDGFDDLRKSLDRATAAVGGSTAVV